MSKTCNQCNLSFPLESFRKGHNQCKSCERIKTLCVHNKPKTRCRQCGGGVYCEHDKRRSNCDKCGGCSKKRPDVLIDLLLYSIIIECDEEQHKNYECENKRTMQLFEDLGERPLILIRFNPDSYVENKKKIKGCFTPLTKIEDIHKKKFYDLNEEEWKRRVDILEEVIRGKIKEEIPEKEVEELKLFYDV